MRASTLPCLFACLAACLLPGAAIAIDLAPLWVPGQPAATEQKLRAALDKATGDDALILRTQIARTLGLRQDFDGARRLLREMEPAIATAGAEAQVRFQLELGRTYASAVHPAALLTPEAKADATRAFERALQRARDARLDGLAIDAVHMFAFVDTAPESQLKWGRQALQISLGSAQPEARRWEASIRNNVGYALHQLGRYDEALAEFQAALAIRERGTNAEATHAARWMVAWTLRSLGRVDDALAIQLALEKQADAANQPDAYVYEELAALYRAKGNADQARRYEERRAAAEKR